MDSIIQDMRMKMRGKKSLGMPKYSLEFYNVNSSHTQKRRILGYVPYKVQPKTFHTYKEAIYRFTAPLFNMGISCIVTSKFFHARNTIL